MPAYDFVYMSDHGKIGAEQTAVADRIIAINPALLISGGDGCYAASDEIEDGVSNEAALNASWTAFDDYSAVTVPAIGNHERDGQPTAAGFLAKFATQTGGLRYYRHYHALSRTGIYVLDTGLDTGLVQRQPDGVGVGSVQHEWLQDEINDNAADEDVRLIVQHHLPVGLASVSSKIRTACDFYPEFLSADAILGGHVHANWSLKRRGTYYFCCGAPTNFSHNLPRTLYGNTKDAQQAYRNNDSGGYSEPCILKITRDGNMTTYRFIRVSDGFVRGPKVVTFARPK